MSRSKGNQATKFIQLIEYNMRRNMSLAKSYTKSTSSPTHLFGLGRRQKRDCSGNEVDTKCGGDTIPRLFSKRSKLIISLDQ